MKYSDESYDLRIELDTENCELSAGEISHLEKALSPLRKPVQDFPVASLYVTIQFMPPSNDYRVKVVLQLPGRALATGDVDQDYSPAFHRCVRKLVHKVTAYKQRMEGSEAISKHLKGTRHGVTGGRVVDLQAVQEAVDNGSYTDFRQLTYPFEGPVRERVGRWVQRYPQIDAQIGQAFEISDIVEEVFLNAFERYDENPREVSLGDWLENLIDPSVKLLSQHTEEELENINLARCAMESSREAEESER